MSGTPALDALSLASLPLLVRDQASTIEQVHLLRVELQRLVTGDLAHLMERARLTGAVLAPNHRGDSRCWMTPALCKEFALEHTQTHIKLMVAYLNRLGEHLSTMLDLPGPLLNGDFSIQFAHFPGNGARYVRHLDSSAGPVMRRLTAILYLNESPIGGCLRAYLPRPPRNNNKLSLPPHVDVEPSFGRMVVFRSDLVEHEVLPCLSERMAITVWAYGADHSAVPPLPPVLPPSDSSASSSSGSVFVSVAAYRDSELVPTLLDLFRTAASPSSVFVGAVWQGEASDPEAALASHPALALYSTQIRSVFLPFAEATGPCLARHFAQSLWRGETFVLQIDSHMRFAKAWDERMVSALRFCEERGSRRPVLTAYPQGYEPPDRLSADRRPTLLYPSHFDADGMLRQRARPVQPSADALAMPSPLWAAGFSFSRSSVICHVPYDPHLPQLFFGEEASMAARLFTHGYDLFAPCECLIYHLWSRAHRATQTADPALSATGADERAALRRRSQRRVKVLLGMCAAQESPSLVDRSAAVGARFGLGTARALSEFAKSAGVDFAESTVLGGEMGSVGAALEAPDVDCAADSIAEVRRSAVADSEKELRMLAALSLVQSFLTK